MYRTWGGKGLFLADQTFAPRWGFALTGLLAAGGLFTAALGKARLLYDAEAEKQAVGRGLGLAGWAILGQAAAGIGLLVRLPEDQRQVILGGASAVFFAVAAAGLAGAAVLTHLARRGPSAGRVAMAGCLYFLALLGLAFLRDAARQQAVADGFCLSETPLNPQWGPFAMFLVFFVAASGVIVYLVRLSLTAGARAR